jgi:hypothetical protein
MTLQAVDCYFSKRAFTNEEINAYMHEVDTVFGKAEGSGILNAVLDTLQEHGFTNASKDFGMAFVVTIAETALHIEKTHSLYGKFGAAQQ